MNAIDPQHPKLKRFLLGIDRDLASKSRSAGCRHCGGVLHSAQYPRKVFGIPIETESTDETKRFSFCCETCRRRTTPASVRFLGRRVYPAAVMLMLSAMRNGVTAKSASALRETFGVARRTLQRWRHWWTTLFVKTPFWIYGQAAFMPTVDERFLPSSLIDRFIAEEPLARFVQCLLFIRPVTAPGLEPFI